MAMAERIIERCGAWQIASAQAPSGRYWSWAKMGPITGTSPLDEPGQHVWAQSASTREKAVAALKHELGLQLGQQPLE